ncbi:hypothetical protein J4573_27140 [Actinomadura barringtoniae]|uniref:Uncharacterized protein n=1 Tax=Actinomadura barringtoniae TaxID=1427535 RepID=A0A939T5M5_9ACTN|nr:hypothetical protein [Actinomadura barringtoniae]MBO2450803.1 hypothetical protein [Actinomadura barringtoniae]
MTTPHGAGASTHGAGSNHHAIREDLAGRAIEQRPPRRLYLTGARQADPPPIPPVELAPVADLMATARASALHGMVIAQIDWIREGREVGANGELSPAALTEFLDVTDERVSSAASESAEMAEAVRQFWGALVGSGILHIDTARSLVWPGPNAVALTGTDGQAALHAWRTFLIAMLDLWSGLGRGEPEEQGLSTNILISLYAHGGPVPRTKLSPLIDEARAYTQLHLDTLTHAGLLQQDPELVCVTTLGTYVCHALLEEASGLRIPVLGSYADADAAVLLQAITAYPVERIPVEAHGWLGDRPAEEGAAAIRAALLEVGPMARRAGLDLLAGTFGDTFGMDGRRTLLELAGDERLGALAFNYLSPTQQAQIPTLGRATSTWALIDLAAMSLEAGTPAHEMVHGLGYVDQPAGKMAKLIDLFGDADHPWAARVLDAMIAHHPEPEVVEAARSARDRLGD